VAAVGEIADGIDPGLTVNRGFLLDALESLGQPADWETRKNEWNKNLKECL